MLAKLCVVWRRILHIRDSRKSEGEGFPDPADDQGR